VVFAKTAILTGVRRPGRDFDVVEPSIGETQSDDDCKPDYGSHLKRFGSKAPPPLPKPPPVEAVRPPDPQRVRTQVRQCKNDDDAGEIVEGYYDVRDGQVFVWTVENGSRPLGQAPVRPGDDVASVARRLLREKVGRGGFWHRLH